MPKVPEYGDRRVGEAALPAPRLSESAPIEAFGGGEAAAGPARQLRGAAQDLQQIEAEESERQDLTRLLEERRALNEWERQNIHDAKTGAINRVGKDAFGLPESLADGFDKFVAEREKALSTDRQREIFRQAAEARRAEVLEWASRHERTQSEVVRETEFEASLESAKERASTNPQAGPTELALVRHLTYERAKERGWGNEQIAQELRRHETDLHYRTVARMLAQEQDLQASGYFAKVKDRLDPDVAVKLEAAVQEGSRRGESQRIVDRMFSTYYEEAQTGAASSEVKAHYAPTTFEEARKEIEAIKDPKLRDMVEDRVKERLREMKFAEAMRQSEVYEAAAKALDARPGASPRDVVSPVDWQELKAEYRDALSRRAARDDHDPKAWLDLVDLASASPTKVAAMTRAEFEARYWSRFDQQHRAKAESIWAEAREAERKGGTSEKLTDFLAPTEIVKTELRRAGVIPWTGQMEDEHVQKLARFEEIVQAKINDFERKELKSQRKASDKEIREITQGLLKEKVFVEKSWWFDPEKKVADLADDERGRAYVPIASIPSKDIETIRRRLQSRGRKYSDEKAQRLRAAELMDDFDLYESILNERD